MMKWISLNYHITQIFSIRYHNFAYLKVSIEKIFIDAHYSKIVGHFGAAKTLKVL